MVGVFLVVLGFKLVFEEIRLRTVFCFILKWFTTEISFLSYVRGFFLDVG